MDEVDPGETEPGALPPRAGELLRAAREAQGLSVADVGQRTRIPLRHLEAIEAGDYASLPSPTYAVGFARAYARAVGADEVAIGAAVRAEVDRIGRRTPEYEPYEMADPARVPSRGVAIVGLGLALAVLILVGLWYGTDMFRGGASTSQPGANTPAVVASVPVAKPRVAATAPTGGQVVLTARDEVWMRVYDADNKTLKLGTMKPGESYTVPADAKDPMINVGRADKLAVTLNGAAVAPLGTGERAIKDVKVSGAAIAARAANATQPSAQPSPTASPNHEGEHRAERKTRHEEKAKPKLSETQRANLDSASSPPPAGNTSTP